MNTPSNQKLARKSAHKPVHKPARRKDARPAEIIEAGLAEFAANGFSATRLEDVAVRAGIVKGTIYRYFDSKEALFKAAVRSRVISTLDEMAAIVDVFPGSSEALLSTVIKAAHRQIFASELPVLIKIMVAEGNRFPDLLSFYYEETICKAEALLQRIVQRGVASGEFNEGAAANLPMIIMSPAMMTAIWSLTFAANRPIQAEDFLEAHLDLVFNGLKARPPKD